MHLKFQNAEEAYVSFSNRLPTWEADGNITTRSDSRNGPVVKFNEPVTITYKNPTQRVLFNKERDANPFFHLYESLWMLAGRNDVASLDFYNANMKNYSDDRKIFNGAYGYRWRHAEVASWECDSIEDQRVDQLKVLIDHLKNNLNSRRAVLQMWNVEDDLLKISESLDVCCNLSCSFHVREVFLPLSPWIPIRYLDMTVFNRSNDLVWGALGANAVHFSFLQEYVALAVGIEVGEYHQISSNLHYYVDKWHPKRQEAQLYPIHIEHPLVQDVERFDREVQAFVVSPAQDFEEPFLEHVAKPACLAFAFHKQRKYTEAYVQLLMIENLDWQQACYNWIAKRHLNWVKKQEV